MAESSHLPPVVAQMSQIQVRPKKPIPSKNSIGECGTIFAFYKTLDVTVMFLNIIFIFLLMVFFSVNGLRVFLTAASGFRIPFGIFRETKSGFYPNAYTTGVV